MIDLNKVFNRSAMVYGGFVALLTAVFGKYWFLFLGFAVLTVTDYITGYLKAKMRNEYSSRKGREGVYKKFGNFVTIALAFFASYIIRQIGEVINIDLSITMMFGWYTLAVFIVNETDSIIENLVQMNVNVPPFLVKGFELCSNAINKVVNVLNGDEKEDDEK